MNEARYILERKNCSQAKLKVLAYFCLSLEYAYWLLIRQGPRANTTCGIPGFSEQFTTANFIIL